MFLLKRLNEVNSSNPWLDSDRNSLDEEFKIAESKFKMTCADVSDAKWKRALLLADIVERGLYSSFHNEFEKLRKAWDKANPGNENNPYFYIGKATRSCNSAVLFSWAKERFGISRTSIYDALGVVDTFTVYDSNRNPGERFLLSAEAKMFAYWQLVEMLSLSYDERLKIKPNWTREEIRAYKRALAELKKKKIDTSSDANEEKPIEDGKYLRFKKFNRKQLIDKIVELEAEIEKYKSDKESISSAAVKTSVSKKKAPTVRRTIK